MYGPALPTMASHHLGISAALKGVKRRRRLLVARWNLDTLLSDSTTHRRIGHRVNGSDIELGNDVVGRAPGDPKPMPVRGVNS